MKIIIGVPSDLDKTLGNGFYEAYRKLCEGITDHDVITFSVSGGDIELASSHVPEEVCDDSSEIESYNYDLMNQYYTSLSLSKDFSEKIKGTKSDFIIAFNSMGRFLNVPYIYYTSTVPYSRVLKIVENEYPKGNHHLSKHFEKLKEYYKFVADNEKINYTKSDYNVVFSHKIREAIIEEYSIDPKKVVYLPRAIPKFDLADKKKDAKLENNTKKIKLILMPAQLRVMKGIKYAIETMKILKTQMKNAVLVICGSIHPYEKEYVKELLEEAKGKANIIVAGFLPKEQLYKYMNIADCAFLPFCFDECPIALTESIGHGLPVVTNEFAGYEKSVINTFGYCAEYNNADDYAQALIRMLTDNEFREEKVLGCKKVTEEFTIEKFKEAISNVLK